MNLLLMAVVPPNRSVVVLRVRLHCKLGCGREAFMNNENLLYPAKKTGQKQ